MIVHKATKSLLLKLKPELVAQIRGIFPQHSMALDYLGHNLAVKHELHVIKVLRNMGIKAPSPIRYYYNWPRPSRFAEVFDHQYATADFLTMYKKCFVLNEMGTSKTASILWAADYLMKLGLIKRVLIVTTMSTMTDVWVNELFDVCMHRSCTVLQGAADRRKEKLALKSDFYIINHDALRIVQKEILGREDIDLIIVDEAAEYRNADTERYAVLKRVTAKKKLWLATGAPCPNAPTDAWALARLVDPSRVPAHFNTFKRMTMYQVTQYRWLPKPGSHEIAYNAMQPAIRFKKSECLNLPAVLYTNRSCDLSPEQKVAYAAMKTHLVAEAGNIKITAVNAADKIGKLRQILCGAVKDKVTGEYIIIPHGPRLKVLIETIQQSNAKVLIIVPFKGILRALADELQAWHDSNGKGGDGRRVEIVNGDITPKERTRIFSEFKNDASLTELVCHPRVMAHGLNLIEADMVIFYAPIHSNDQDAQVRNRIDRPGQTKSMTIARIAANAMERAIYDIVEQKSVTQESILSLYKKELQL
jgi:SNF2 family DNA or RNA helicase